MTEPTAGAVRSTDLRLARLHLRMGSLALARAELEALAGVGELDDPALLDLAEARWRTGDLAGAGEAAAAAIAAGNDSVLGLVIAAEARSAAGRPAEARRLAGQAIERAGRSLDSVFAGIPRGGVWPHDPSAPATPAGTLFAEPRRAGRADRHPPAAGSPAPAPALPPAGAPSSGPRQPTLTTPSRLTASGQRGGQAPSAGLWDEEPAVPPAGGPPFDAAAEFDAAHAALAAGDVALAAIRLAVVLRFAPAHAPAVIALLDGITGAPAELVRGDAYRLVGHETAARRAFEAAAAALEPRDPEHREGPGR